MLSVIIDKLNNEIKNRNLTLEEISIRINKAENQIKNFLQGYLFTKEIYEEISKIVYENEYEDINILSSFSSEELLKELLKREKK